MDKKKALLVKANTGLFVILNKQQLSQQRKCLTYSQPV
jgi:hypothetical protein